jgi:GNAT superfamily N-acetyltransferase
VNGINAGDVSSFVSVQAGDETDVIGTLVSAFIDDPVERWLWPEAQQYLTQFPAFVAAFGGEAFTRQTVWTLGGFAAVAWWIAPGFGPDADAIIAVLAHSVSSQQHQDVFSVLEQMDSAHPRDAHWYLPWLGVDSPHRGAGLGGRLLKRCLEVVDADHLPAFLETPNPRTVPFYGRFGFEVTSVAQAGACPPVTSMLRPAQ